MILKIFTTLTLISFIQAYYRVQMFQDAFDHKPTYIEATREVEKIILHPLHLLARKIPLDVIQHFNSPTRCFDKFPRRIYQIYFPNEYYNFLLKYEPHLIEFSNTYYYDNQGYNDIYGYDSYSNNNGYNNNGYNNNGYNNIYGQSQYNYNLYDNGNSYSQQNFYNNRQMDIYGYDDYNDQDGYKDENFVSYQLSKSN